MSWFRHAFALDPPGPSEPTDEERVIVERLSEMVVRRGLSAPALVFLEMSRPLNRLAAQAMQFFRPIASLVLTVDEYDRFARFLEKPSALDCLCQTIERRAAQPERRDPAASAPASSLDS